MPARKLAPIRYKSMITETVNNTGSRNVRAKFYERIANFWAST